ncbi:uncharacterized protein EV154DRAFT_562778 [Mucor mucedo]|uniref:uncharacterized protein n=1 Tax=Mucor mucedo TaxID=29922 RepID=UPI0022204735|nr:uncharacterized protein EV154DRAFT_562778 [Mucor mucedo]KAI7891927.1 hypothetical protein EV154DRAFT_562778 [Mucor mucedo]
MNLSNELFATAHPRSQTSSSANAVRRARSQDIRSSTRPASLTSDVTPAQVGLNSDSDTESNYDDAASNIDSDSDSVASSVVAGKFTEREFDDSEDDRELNDDSQVVDFANVVSILEKSSQHDNVASFADFLAHVHDEVLIVNSTDFVEELEICDVNVDAFITHGLRDIPLLPDNCVRFYLSPPFSTRITRLDYGTYEHHNFKMPVKDYHHTLRFTMDGQCHLEIHIIFPNMKELGVEMRTETSIP